MTHATGPKISSRAARASLSTGHRTVGANQKPGPSGAEPRIATGASFATNEATSDRRSAEMSGPIAVSSSSGSPTRTASTASSKASMKRSMAPRSTRIRDRAQQSWPALPKTAEGADAAASSRSASANTMLADLPPSSSVTRLIVCAAAADDGGRVLPPGLGRPAFDRRRGGRGDRPPALGRAGERDLRHVGVLDEPLPAHAPRTGDDVDDAFGQAGLERDVSEPERSQR